MVEIVCQWPRITGCDRTDAAGAARGRHDGADLDLAFRERRIVPQILGRMAGKFSAEAGQPFGNVSRITRLAEFAVADHIDADCHLPRDDGRYGRCERPMQIVLADGFAAARACNMASSFSGRGRLPT